MIKNEVKLSLLAIALGSILALSSTALAETHDPVKTNTTSLSEVQMSQNQINSFKDTANKALEKRLESLQDLISRISTSSAIPEANKSSIIALLKQEISNVDSVKGRIDQVADMDALRTEAGIANKNLAIFNYLKPQASLVVATGTLSVTADRLATASGKLQTYVDKLKAGGTDTGSMQSGLDDMNAKIADARTQVAAAKTALATLSPTSTNNKTVLQSVLEILKKGRTDLQAARQDGINVISELRKAIKGTKPSPTPSASPTSNP